MHMTAIGILIFCLTIIIVVTGIAGYFYDLDYDWVQGFGPYSKHTITKPESINVLSYAGNCATMYGQILTYQASGWLLLSTFFTFLHLICAVAIWIIIKPGGS